MGGKQLVPAGGLRVRTTTLTKTSASLTKVVYSAITYTTASRRHDMPETERLFQAGLRLYQVASKEKAER